MAGNNTFNNNDSMDINELAALNSEEFSPELIEQLQQKITQDAQSLIAPTFNENDDTTLFEETSAKDGENGTVANTETPDTSTEKKQNKVELDSSIDDNFIKKYKAKLNKQSIQEINTDNSTNDTPTSQEDDNTAPIEQLSDGKITEKAISNKQREYNNSLDFLDGNVKYSKYVIYIDPQNVDFIEGLTVKERKNLINKILREQDDILISKKQFGKIQTIITHIILAVITVTISIPITYYLINASLEASINNHRRAQTNFQTLYKEHGKITNTNK